MTQEFIYKISKELRYIAKFSHGCWRRDLKYLTGLNIEMCHDMATERLRFLFTDDRLPDEYYKFDMPRMVRAACCEEMVSSAGMEAKHETINLRDHKFRCVDYDYPYHVNEHSESLVATKFGLWGIPIRFERRAAWTEKKPDFDRVAELILMALKEFKNIHDANTKLIPR
jgi:hypothetical protein